MELIIHFFFFYRRCNNVCRLVGRVENDVKKLSCIHDAHWFVGILQNMYIYIYKYMMSN